ncbi:MAG: hypothetical protein ABSD53_12505 [Terriglobales bacterium]
MKRSDLSISKTLCEERLAGLIRAFRERQRCRGIKYESSARYAGVDFGNDLVDCFFLFTSTACREDTFRFCYDLRHSFGFASPLLGGGASTVTPVIYVALPVETHPIRNNDKSTYFRPNLQRYNRSFASVGFGTYMPRSGASEASFQP